MSTQAAVIEPKEWQRESGARLSSIARPATTVVVCTLLVKVIATVKEFVVAGAFGRSDALDAFLAAFLVPALLINLVAESMCQTLVPELVRVRVEQGAEAARELFAASLGRLCSTVLLACAGVALVAPWCIRWVGWSFPAAKLVLTLHLLYGVLPFAAFGAFGAVCGAVLNSTGSCAAPALAQAVVPVMTLLAVPVFAKHAGPWTLVCATVGGAMLHALWMAAATARAGYPVRIQWQGGGGAARRVSRQQAAVLASSLVASGGIIADQAMAASLAAGSVSSLAFAGRFVSVALALAAGVASAAVAPHFAALAARRDWNGCRTALRHWSRLAWSASIAAAVVMICGAHALVRLCLQHGAFKGQDTEAVSRVLIFSALQIPFFAASRVHYRFLLAMKRADLILICGTINLVLDVILNVVLMRRLGVAGIALATSLWTVATWLFFSVCARRILAQEDGGFKR